MMKGLRQFFLILMVFNLTLLPITGCGRQPVSSLIPSIDGSTASIATQKESGEIKTGKVAVMQTVEVSPEGAVISFNKTDDPLDGFELTVPPSAYTEKKEFIITQKAILSHTFGDAIHPISPLITVENGGNFSEEPMTVRIPVKVSANHFAMGFFYDVETGTLEGIPMISFDGESITVATQHFSSFFISEILKTTLTKDMDTKYRPGVDDWQFANFGSYIAKGGHCAGQCVAALWYYLNKPDGDEISLFGRYDNNGNTKTPSLWQDDSLGYRFCSTVHYDIWNTADAIEKKMILLNGRMWKQVAGVWKYVDIPGIGDEAAFYLLAYSILVTEQPQMVGIWSNAGGGHCMICYRISGGKLYISDPNYPGNLERQIEYANESFKPYNSGANKEDIDNGGGKAYEKIMYYSNWSLINKDLISNRWKELKDGSVGTDLFPAYTITYKDEKGVVKELKDNTVIPQKKIDIFVNSSVSGATTDVYRNGAILPYDDQWLQNLVPGNNRLGILTTAKVGNLYKYVDFKYMNVICTSLTVSPDPLKGEIGKEYTFHADLENPPDDIVYEWSVNNEIKQSNSSPDFSLTFDIKGEYKVSVWAGSAGTELGKDDAKAMITDPKPTLVNINPYELTGEVGKEYTFTASLDNPWPDVKYEWSINNGPVQPGLNPSFNWTFPSKGDYIVKVVARITDLKLDFTFERKVTITDKEVIPTEQSHLPYLQKNGFFETELRTKAVMEEYDFYTNPQNTTREVMEGIACSPLQITWNETVFSGTEKLPFAGGDESTRTVNGSVSPDGNVLLSLTYTFQSARYSDWENPSKDNCTQTSTQKLMLQNIPIKYNADGTPELSEYKSAEIQKYVVEIVNEVTDIDVKKKSTYHTVKYVSPKWDQDSGVMIFFHVDSR